MNKVHSSITPNWHPGRAAVAGTVATLVYSVSMEGDKFITGNHFNDVRFITSEPEDPCPSDLIITQKLKRPSG